MEDDLLLLFDLENSVLSRMAYFKYFSSNAALFENSLLYRDGRKNLCSARMEISLSNTALKLLSEGLNGEKMEFDGQKKELSSDFDSVGVGYVKDPEYTMDDVLLKDDIKDKVKLFLDAFRDNKLEAIGIKERIKKGLGTVFLFYGPPGTGKSMLAEAIAKYVNKKILMVEYPKIMERWVGATDKNISNIFKVAEKDSLVVVLDEADTLFYNRAFAFQEHDIRFVNEMLQELERFNGMIILTTNMTELLDQALERRVSLKVKFENPNKEARFKIWQSHLPKKLKVSDDVDFNFLANKYDFAGGNIKNAVLNAIRKMVSRNDDTLLMQDLIFGADMEKDGMYSALHKEPIGFLAN
jgi:SpoVK/Ycf46/Vps4 family AAA+-type ATPase